MNKLAQNRKWFDNCGYRAPNHSLSELKAGMKAGLLNEQDEYGMTALAMAVMSNWTEGVEELLRAGADTELRYFRTGETVLYMAVQNRNEVLVKALIKGGANPDAGNYWGVTPRAWISKVGSAPVFEAIPAKEVQLPDPFIQNAEHLADHYHPEFKIPKRKERETLQPGQAVDLYVYGPRSDSKQDTVKVRISKRTGQGVDVRYIASIETPIERTHLPAESKELEFGPENVATVYVTQGSEAKKDRK